jgi:hypothetical protein
MHRRLWLYVLSVLAATSLLAASCGGKTPEPSGGSGGGSATGLRYDGSVSFHRGTP